MTTAVVVGVGVGRRRNEVAVVEERVVLAQLWC